MSKKKHQPPAVTQPPAVPATVKSESVRITNKLFQLVSFTILDQDGKQHGLSIVAKGIVEWPRCKFGVDVTRLCRNGSLVIS